MSDAIIRLFVLAGFVFMALTFILYRQDSTRFWVPGLSVLCFSIALVLHIIGMVSP